MTALALFAKDRARPLPWENTREMFMSALATDAWAGVFTEP